MRRTALNLAGLWLALSANAYAADDWHSVAAVGEVSVRVHWVSRAELTAAARSVGQRTDAAPMGFSVLRKNTATGGFSCDVYLLDRPTRLQDRATASLGHEMAHCLGFSHERRAPKQAPAEQVDTAAPP